MTTATEPMHRSSVQGAFHTAQQRAGLMQRAVGIPTLRKVCTGWFRDACLAHRYMHSPLEPLLVGMGPPDHAGAWGARYLGGRKHVWPPPGAMRMGICARQGLRKVDSPCSGLASPGMQRLDVLERRL